ncbi:hypothetical protein [Candidatus Palauibacter sp.]|uniref:hypothetical protein n=1 Tax=Candidatus Palauibacter sp. TaxID=3101350 RepID=UPI003B5CB0A3
MANRSTQEKGLPTGESPYNLEHDAETFQDTFPDVDPRDLGLGFLYPVNYEAQLIAIRGLLGRNDTVDNAIGTAIGEIRAEIETDGFTERAFDEWTERVEQHFYQATAHSMAAVGLIAPLMESLFYWTFYKIGESITDSQPMPSQHKRWRIWRERQWDCHWVWRGREPRQNIVDGIWEFICAFQMQSYLPSDLKKTLEALFAYRNKMLHCGLEWPLGERKSFEKQMTNRKWPVEWFDRIGTKDEPRIFYMAPKFIAKCLNSAENTIEGVGEFVSDAAGRGWSMAGGGADGAAEGTATIAGGEVSTPKDGLV